MSNSEFMFTLAMLTICIVGFIWIMKQIILLGYWFYKHEMDKVKRNE